MSTDAPAIVQAVEAETGALIGAPGDAAQLDLLRSEDGKLPSDVFRQLRRRAGPGRPKGSINRNTRQLARIIVERHGDPLLAMAETAAMPLDQFVELMMVADGSRDREERLMDVTDRIVRLTDRMLDDADGGRILSDKSVERLEGLTEQAANLARTLKVKPGELGLKAFVAQRDTRKAVAEYVHSKMPIAVDVNTRADVILNIPGLTDPSHLAAMVDVQELGEADLQRIEFAQWTDVDGSGGGEA